MTSIPVIIITGFLGAGKTTLIRSLTSQLRSISPSHQSVWLKNEFGDQSVDTALAGSAVTVKEIVNGCLCCQMVGQLANALTELSQITPRPDHLFIETSGSAYPGPLVREISRLQNEENCNLKLASVVCVIDCENFTGYADTSFTAKLQAKCTDLILLNKHEVVSEAALDRVIDQIADLTPDTPRLKTDKGSVDAHLIVDLSTEIDRKLLASQESISYNDNHHSQEIEVLTIRIPSDSPVNMVHLSDFLRSLSKDTFYRVKGFVWTSDGPRLLNFAFGRWEFVQLDNGSMTTGTVITIMGVGIVPRMALIRSALNLNETELTRIQ